MAPEIIPTPLQGLLLLKPVVFSDNRGYFAETYNHTVFSEIGITESFVQDNQSMSHKGALRGLHFQNPPHAQSKLVRVVAGSVLDVVVDIRQGSLTYGQNFVTELSDKNFHQLYIPEGFAHGFVTLEDHTIFAYKCSSYYNKASEDGLMWNDPDLNIDWQVTTPIISGKDQELKYLRDFNSPFIN